MPSSADARPAAAAEATSPVEASSLTTRSLELARDQGWPVRTAPLYGPEGSAVYARLTGEDRTEIREIVSAARRTEGPILELAAGAGRLTLPLLALGRPVTAVDSSAEMLAQLDRRLPPRHAERLTPVLVDMTSVVAGGAFGLVVLGATSITLLDTEGRRALYDVIAASAAVGARFVVTVAEGGAPAPCSTESGGADGPVLSHETRGERRLVNILVPPGAEGVATVLVSSVTRLERGSLVAELVARGFEPVAETVVRCAGGAETGVVLVEAVCPPR